MRVMTTLTLVAEVNPTWATVRPVYCICPPWVPAHDQPGHPLRPPV